MKKRTDFASALHKTLDILKTGEPYSLNKLSEKANLNFRTIRKVIEVLEDNQSSLSGKSLDVSILDNLTMVRMKEKSGLNMFPEHIQNLIIKTMYYPTVSKEEEILVYLFLKNALDVVSATSLPENSIIQELVSAEHVGKTSDGKYYLTSDGRYIAKGALKLYPELENISSRFSVVSEISSNMQLVQMAILNAPNMLVIKNRMMAGRIA